MIRTILVATLQVLLISSIHMNQNVDACRVSSEKLKTYTTKSIERLLDAEILASIYWPEEPLNARTLSKVTGINVTLAETTFSLDNLSNASQTNKSKRVTLINDIFVTCSADRDRSFTLTINLELNSPFKVIILRYRLLNDKQEPEFGLFHIRLPESTFLVQMSQRISYDECLDVNYVQLSPSVAYEIECLDCDEGQKIQLDKNLSKRMTQLDAELDTMLSDKLLLGLKTLLEKQRLDLDLYLS